MPMKLSMIKRPGWKCYKFGLATTWFNGYLLNTIIIVTHNISSIIDADSIVVVNKGVIESHGRHSDLIIENGWYGKTYSKLYSH